MKKIDDYRTLLEVEKSTDLKTLKTAYRNVMKQWHPDKFHADEDGRIIAEEKSKTLIEAYHFLVSIAPETIAANLSEYSSTINECGIADFKHKGLLLEITFTDGSCYEYFGVNANVYKKLINSDKQVRFAKRFIYDSYLYRKAKKASEEG